MKYLVLISLLVMFSCKKAVAENKTEEVEPAVVPFDTAAIDSFSTGATSVNVARKIEMSGKRYQDSLKSARKMAEAEKKAREDAKKIEVEASKALNKEKDKAHTEIKKTDENVPQQK